MPKSIIYRDSIIANKNPHRLANDEYYLVYIQNQDGELFPTLLTQSDIKKGLFRAARNPEDAPMITTSWWSKFFGYFRKYCQ